MTANQTTFDIIRGNTDATMNTYSANGLEIDFSPITKDSSPLLRIFNNALTQIEMAGWALEWGVFE